MRPFLKIISVLLLILAGIVLLLLKKYFSAKLMTDSLYLVLFAFLLIVTGAFLIKNSIRKSAEKDAKILRDNLLLFKSDARKINVDLGKCIIKTSEYSIRKEQNAAMNIQLYDALYDSSRNVENIKVNQAVLVFETVENGQKKVF